MRLQSRVLLRIFVVLAILLFVFAITTSAQVMQGPTTIRQSVHNDLSLPLRVLAQQAPSPGSTSNEAEEVKRVPLPPGLVELAEDPVRQMLAPVTASPAVGLSFEGLGIGQYGFIMQGAPPDTNGAVGATQYVQWVNLSFAVLRQNEWHPSLGPTCRKHFMVWVWRRLPKQQ